MYIKNVGEPWFSLITLGIKTIEGRLNKGDFKKMKSGDIIKWINNDIIERNVLTKIIRITEYKTFKEYILSEGLDKCLPSINNIKNGLDIYYSYYSKEDEKKYGVISIEIKLL